MNRSAPAGGPAEPECDLACAGDFHLGLGKVSAARTTRGGAVAMKSKSARSCGEGGAGEGKTAGH